MKKLLIILLLFFPVHGAWGKTISVQCKETEASDIMNIFIMDTKTGFVSNGSGNKIGHKLIITDELYSWKETPGFIEYMKRLSNDKFYKGATHRLDRITGEKYTIMDFHDRPSVTYKDQCEKRDTNRNSNPQSQIPVI